MQTLKCIIQEAFDSLEVDGLFYRTGDFRRGKDGDLQPVYRLTVASEWLDQTGLTDEFHAFADARRACKFKRTSNEVLRKIEN